MTSKRYITTVGLWLVILCLTSAGCNVWMDPYGLFSGKNVWRPRSIFSNERATRYLFSLHYIPANFDAVLLGSSSTDNYNFSEVTGSRIYNASVDGGNASEACLMGRNILKNSGRVKVLLVCLSPYLTRSAGLKSSSMRRSEYWGALGSFDIAKTYLRMVLVRLGISENYYNAYGQNRYFSLPSREESLSRLREEQFSPLTPVEIHEEPAAVQELDSLFKAARQKNVRVAVFFPPRTLLRSSRRDAFYRSYRAHMGRLFSPRELLVDFDDASHEMFKADKSNFYDHLHLSEKGARMMVEELVRLIDSQQDGPLPEGT